MSKIRVNNTEITILQNKDQDYISLTDIVRNYDNSHILIANWLRKKDTLEYLGIWERLNNPDFKLIEFDEFKNKAGTNVFTLSPQRFIEKTSAIGLISKSGRYGGTYAHKDIAFHFAMWLSPEFQLLIVKEFQRLKEEEGKLKNSEWEFRRFLTKVNYRLHTDAIKETIIPLHQNIKKEEEAYIYANEAEMLNVAVFGKTSKQWKQENHEAVLKGFNMRDMASIPQLTVLSNLENYNSILVKQGMSIKDRFERLKTEAISQLKSLSQYQYTVPIESPNLMPKPAGQFDETLKGLLSVPPPTEEDK